MNDSKIDLLFYTYGIGDEYRKFTIPFIFFASMANPNTRFEIAIDNLDSFNRSNYQALNYLTKIGIDYRLTELQLELVGIVPNSVRFLQQPVTKTSGWIYITDIDIMMVDLVNFEAFGKKIEGRRYFNIRRENGNLTACHIGMMEDIYGMDRTELAKMHINLDEKLLTEIYKYRGIPENDSQKRPLFGLHMSPNRNLYDTKPSWGLSIDTCNKIFSILQTKKYKALRQVASEEMLTILKTLEVVVYGVKCNQDSLLARMIRLTLRLFT